MAAECDISVRSIDDVARSLKSVRIHLEPIKSPPTCGEARGDGTVFGVDVYSLPCPGAACAGEAAWYRVIGVDGIMDCESTSFIVAVLPGLIPQPLFGLVNTGYLDFPSEDVISSVNFAWSGDLIKGWPPKPPHVPPVPKPPVPVPGHSTLTIDNHSLVDLWLVWTGDAESSDLVSNGHASKHGGGNLVSANFLVTFYKNDNGRVGQKIGNNAFSVHGADAGELVVRGNFLYFISAGGVATLIGAIIAG
ncbi:MAG: hypothetical protein JWP89_6142 [Schlesneria sp.]|nr:hypothetical protein [Schlesneria sp.]